LASHPVFHFCLPLEAKREEALRENGEAVGHSGL
jgi:hypothetical protein